MQYSILDKKEDEKEPRASTRTRGSLTYKSVHLCTISYDNVGFGGSGLLQALNLQ